MNSTNENTIDRNKTPASNPTNIVSNGNGSNSSSSSSNNNIVTKHIDEAATFNFSKFKFISAYDNILAKYPTEQRPRKLCSLWKTIEDLSNQERQVLTHRYFEIQNIEEKQLKSFNAINDNCDEIIRVYRILCVLLNDYVANLCETRERAIWLANEKQQLATSTAEYNEQIERCNRIYNKVISTPGYHSARFNILKRKGELLTFEEGVKRIEMIDKATDDTNKQQQSIADPNSIAFGTDGSKIYGNGDNVDSSSSRRGVISDDGSGTNTATTATTATTTTDQIYNSDRVNSNNNNNNNRKRPRPSSDCEWFDVVQQIRNEIVKNKIDIIQNYYR